MGPRRYLHLRGTRRIHHARIAARPDSVRISQLAKSHGFSQLNRLTAAHRKQFGEFPSTASRRLPRS